ncbi:39S ribosomal protein L47, mitochondrial-like [Asterias rubens]|uniref:39S ribosomal protein L47, mitochondrial-like n=1 Tax=Asterias rubens TaxID=7604 RepID=UPI00145534A2|nr:39S ribosomal protein L47, mitochondrial-like [Asterias rubens]
MSAPMAGRTMFSLAKVMDKFSYFRAISTKCHLPGTVTSISTDAVNSGPKIRCSLTKCAAHVRHRGLTSHHQQLLNTLPVASSQQRQFHRSPLYQGLEEFFDDPKNYGEPDVKAGRHWEVDDIRLKDNATLHKLWYVLLKEKNMLLTLEAEALRQDRFMPGEERLEKVEKSMSNIQQVIRERNEALTELKTGHKDEHPGKMVYTPFGYRRYLKPREHYVPSYFNKHYQRKRYVYAPYVRKIMGKWMEQEQDNRKKENRRRHNTERKLKKRFPNADVWQND